MPTNPWQATSRTHTPAVLGRPIDDPCAWTREDLEASQIVKLFERTVAVSGASSRVENHAARLREIWRRAIPRRLEAE